MITSLVKATARTTADTVRLLSRPGVRLARRVVDAAFSPQRPARSVPASPARSVPASPARPHVGPHTPTGSRSTSAPYPNEDPEAARSRPR